MWFGGHAPLGTAKELKRSRRYLSSRPEEDVEIKEEGKGEGEDKK